jgi:hypothetical protein
LADILGDFEIVVPFRAAYRLGRPRARRKNERF